MRPSPSKLLATATTASARSVERYLTPGTPTGLTGLRTHPCPRSTLVYLYSLTLKKLATLPAHSAYRVATTALTQHRLDIVQKTEPAGYAAWAAKARAALEENKPAFGTEVFQFGEHAPEAFEARRFQREGFRRAVDPHARSNEWDGIASEEPLEGIRTQHERDMVAARDRGRDRAQHYEGAGVAWVDSPALEASQYVFCADGGDVLTPIRIQEIEDKIGQGLIEEVIQVAEGEAQLVDEMKASEV